MNEAAFLAYRVAIPPSFEMKEGVFNQMPDFVEVFVILALMLSVLARGNDGGHALVFGLV